MAFSLPKFVQSIFAFNVVFLQYFGVYTSTRVKDRCIEMMYGWTKTLTNEPKISEAYEMLRKQGLLRVDPAVKELEAEAAKKAAEAETNRLSAASAGSSIPLGLPDVQRKSNNDRKAILDDDRAKTLKMLLQSKKPEDLQAANQLIKESLKQDEERVERHSKRHQELEIVRNNMTLLTDMLDHYEEFQNAQDQVTSPKGSSSDSCGEADMDVMAELYMMLDKHRPALFRMASEIEDTDDDMLAALLRANDDLLEVLARYRHLVNGEPVMMTVSRAPLAKPTKKSTSENNDSSFLVDVSEASTNVNSNPKSAMIDFLSQQLEAAGLSDLKLDSFIENGGGSESEKKPTYNFDSELLALDNNQNGNVQKILQSLSSHTPSLMSAEDVPMPKRGNAATNTTKQMDALDILSREMMQSHFPNNKKEQEKSNIEPTEEKTVTAKAPATSTCLLDTDDAAFEPAPAKVEESSNNINGLTTENLNLEDLTFSLDSFRPKPDFTPLPLYQRNGINIILMLSSESPHPDCKVLLISSTSMATDPITDYKMSFSVHAVSFFLAFDSIQFLLIFS